MKKLRVISPVLYALGAILLLIGLFGPRTARTVGYVLLFVGSVVNLIFGLRSQKGERVKKTGLYPLCVDETASAETVGAIIDLFGCRYLTMSVMALDNESEFLGRIKDDRRYLLKLPQKVSLVSEAVIRSESQNIKSLIADALASDARAVTLYGSEIMPDDFKTHEEADRLMKDGLLCYLLCIELEDGFTGLRFDEKKYPVSFSVRAKEILETIEDT